MPSSESSASEKEALLKEIRENFDYCVREWGPIREEGRKDMRCLNGDPWDPKERQARKGAGRPCLALDELNQYCNQLINDVRQNKRAVKVVPKGDGANDLTAEKRGGMIRQIEYKSKAQAAYRTAFEGAVQRSYGYYGFKTQYVSDSSRDQEIVVKRIPNPDTIYLDPDAREADWSDITYGFEFDTMPKARFRNKFPDSRLQSFTPEMAEVAPAWLKEDRIMVASYWKAKVKKRKLLYLPNGQNVFLDELQEGAKLHKNNVLEARELGTVELAGMRSEETKSVCQYITNGLEILEDNDWVGKYIPIVPVFGREIWVDEDGEGARRKLISLVRLARDPYMLYCYIRTTQAELVGMAPKAPWIGYKGQFDDTNTDWANLHKVPTAFAEANATTDQSRAANSQAILPLPQRTQFEVGAVNLEALAQGARQAIQSSMGITGMLNGTATQTGDAKSGIALKTLDQQESQGNFHYIDNYDIALENGGRQMDDMLDKVYDGTRTAGFRSAANEYSTGPINQLAKDPLSGAVQKVGFHTDQGDHDVTISTAPSFQSEREEAQDFAESISKIPGVFPLIAPELVKLHNLGAIGDVIAQKLAALNPANQSQIPPAIQARLQQLTQIVQQLMQEKQSKTLELQSKAFIANAQQQTDLQKKRMDIIASFGQALIKAGHATEAQQFEAQMEQLTLMWEQMHEFNSQMVEHSHEQAMQATDIAAAPPPAAAAPAPAQPQA